MSNNPQLDEEVKNRVVFFLLFLTSKSCIEECSKFTSPEKLIFKLSKIWFNDIFVPGKVFINAVKNDYSEEKTKYFQDCFDVEEYDVIERFHLFFDLRLNMLNDKSKENEVIPINDMWENILKDAHHVLDEIVPDKNLLREQLEQKVKLAIENNKNILDTFFN